MLEAYDTAWRAAMAEYGITPPKAIKKNGQADIQTPAHKTTNDIQNVIATSPLDKALILTDESGRKAALVPEGIHEAGQVEVRRFSNVFGERVGLVFRIVSGPHLGIELMEAAALKASPRGKLAELLRGMGGANGSLLTAHELAAGAVASRYATRPPSPARLTRPSRRRSSSPPITKGPAKPKGIR